MKKIALLIHNLFQDDELREPLRACRQAGFDVTVIGPEADKTYRGKNLRETITSEMSVEAADARDYDALVIPGGYAPDKLRMVPGAVKLVRAFDDAHKVIAAICHGPQLLISADCVRGRMVTGYESIAVDLKNAGAFFRNAPVVVDGNLITSRKPADLPQFCETLISHVRGEKHANARS